MIYSETDINCVWSACPRQFGGLSMKPNENRLTTPFSSTLSCIFSLPSFLSGAEVNKVNYFNRFYLFLPDSHRNMETENSTVYRLRGFDLARAFAVWGMVLVNFRMIFHGKEGNVLLEIFTRYLDGKAAAAFLIVAGAGLARSTAKARLANNPTLQRYDQWRIIRRAAFLFVLGLGCAFIWPGDILFYFAAFLPFSIPLLWGTPQRIWLAILLFLVGFAAAFFMFNYEPNISGGIMDYEAFFQPETFLSSLFFNGYHPVLPWATFLFMGLWLGRQKLHKDYVRRGVMVPAILILVISQLMTTGVHWAQFFQLIPGFGDAGKLFLSNDPIPPLPLFILNAGSSGMIMVVFFVGLFEKFPKSVALRELAHTGQLWLTIYTAHIVLGIGVPALLGLNLGSLETIEFVWMYGTGFFLIAILFASMWRKRFSHGPLESLFRLISGD